LRRVHRRLLRSRERIALRLGQISSDRPLSDDFGFSRGSPIDRHYIESFLGRHAPDVRGRVLEVGDDSYSRRFGAERVTRQSVLHLHSGHGATIVGDLSTPGVLPEHAFDCIVLTQTLDLVFDLDAALKQLRRSLRPGGTLLLTVAGIASVDRGAWKDFSCWCFREGSVRRLLEAHFDPSKVEVTAYGNLFAATVFLHGGAVEDIDARRLLPFDPAYPVTIAARAVA
jgi:SAM-dependent methyltransferase